MFIKSLTIFHKNEAIRKIDFRLGVNLIVDETPTNERQKTGNNVGKTTFLRLIDYCFGAKKEIIYKKKDSKKDTNSKVEKFLLDSSTFVELILTKKWNNSNNENIVIKRNFNKNNKIQEINHIPITNIEEFKKKLKKIVYGKKEEERPSFRQVFSKNVRIDDQLNNIARVLNKNSKKSEWDSFFLFLLGIQFQGMTEKIQISKKLKKEEIYKKRLQKDYSLEVIIQLLEKTEKEIKKYEFQKNKLLNSDDYQKHTEELDEISKKINEINTKLMGLKYRENLIEESKKELEEQKTNISSEKVKYLYKKAKKLIPELQKSFEETLEFYNQMIKNRMQYITKELPQIEKNILILEKEIEVLHNKENIKKEILKRLGFKDSLETIIEELNRNYEEQGKLKDNKEMLEKIQKTISEQKKKIKEIDEKNVETEKLFEERTKILNDYFYEFSKKLYKKPSSLTHNISNNSDEIRHFDLIIPDEGKHLGKGKILGLIGAFEMAYIKFADELDISIPKFVLQDQLESIDENQLHILFKEIIPSVQCQYIVTLLKDKVNQDQINEYQILKLSQNNKLFKI